MAAPVVQKSMPLELTAVGAAEAYSTVAVHAQITGELTSVSFKDGDDVPRGLCPIHEGNLKQRAQRALQDVFGAIGRGIRGLFGGSDGHSRR